jgi:hypothetical protein
MRTRPHSDLGLYHHHVRLTPYQHSCLDSSKLLGNSLVKSLDRWYSAPMHTLRNYSKKTMKGYCLICNGITTVIKKGNDYQCIYDTSLVIAPKPIDPPKLARGKHEKREQAFISKTDRLRRMYNLSWYEYLLLLDNTNYACAICLDSFTKDNPPHVDHDHSCCPEKVSCGQCVRGLLCRMCNTGIGYFRDSSHALVRASEYLARP